MVNLRNLGGWYSHNAVTTCGACSALQRGVNVSHTGALHWNVCENVSFPDVSQSK